MLKKMFLSTMVFGTLVATSCDNDDDATVVAPTKADLELNLIGLEELGDNFVYEGWIVVDGEAVSTGTFSEVKFPQKFSLDATQLAKATQFVLSIEPKSDTDPKPSNTKILSGSFSDNTAAVDSKSVVGDFSAPAGKYVLATPSNGPNTDEFSGIWFLDNSGDAPQTGFVLPELQAGWKYEGWVLVDGQTISTGTFTDFDKLDDSSDFKSEIAGEPPFPGEDFLENAPEGIEFPLDLRGGVTAISVEPDPDNSSTPFTIKPLLHDIPEDAMAGVAIDFEKGPVTEITGTAKRP